jgi:hypothetical protein
MSSPVTRNMARAMRSKLRRGALTADELCDAMSRMAPHATNGGYPRTLVIEAIERWFRQGRVRTRTVYCRNTGRQMVAYSLYEKPKSVAGIAATRDQQARQNA